MLPGASKELTSSDISNLDTPNWMDVIKSHRSTYMANYHDFQVIIEMNGCYFIDML